MRTTLTGKRVLLTPIAEDDIEFAWTFANAPELRDRLRFFRPSDEDDERAWIDAMQRGDMHVWVMRRPETREPIGFISLDISDLVAGVAELGLGVLGPTTRGQGVGSESIALVLRHGFTTLGLHRIWLHVQTESPAVRLYERAGFRHEGTLRDHVFKGGAHRDVHVMAILRPEWSP